MMSGTSWWRHTARQYFKSQGRLPVVMFIWKYTKLCILWCFHWLSSPVGRRVI